MPFLAHFGFNERPFALTPNSGLYFPSETHQEVLGSLVYAIDRSEGVVKVSGEVGTGKTLLCRLLTAELIKTAAVAYIINPQNDANWIIGAVCREFGLDPDRTSDPLHALNIFLLEQFGAGRRALVVVDEAQALGLIGLETVRRLSNLETESRKLLQIVLFGQPELDRLLQSRALRQLTQRIVFAFSLAPLTPDATADYIRHRVRRSMADGAKAEALFDRRAVRTIARVSQGIPRIANIIADKSLLAAFGQGADRVTARHVRDAIKDSSAVIAALPDRDAGGWGRRALEALNRWAAESAWQAATPAAPRRAKPAATAPAPRPDITVGEAAGAWLADCDGRGLKPATLAERRRHVETFVKPSLGGTKAAALTPDAVASFARSLTDARPAGEARRVLASLNSALAFAVRAGHVAANPARVATIASARPAPPPVAAPSLAELRVLVGSAGPALRPLLVTALLTGLRAAELRALTWDTVDFRAGLIHVRRRVGGHGALGAARPRAARRGVALGPALAAVLVDWRDANPDDGLNLVFPGRDGGLMSAGRVQRGAFARLQISCGVTGGDGKPKYRFDDLRHAAAALLIEQGWPARKVRDALGEASIAAVARRYAPQFERAGDDRAALELIAARLLGPS